MSLELLTRIALLEQELAGLKQSVASKDTFGLARISDLSDVTTDDGPVLSAKEKNKAIAGTMAYQIAQNESKINAIICDPIGSIIPYMGKTAPNGYLACNGGTHNISTYPDLANHFKAEFGSINYFGGDGSTTFAVPDLRGEFLRGTGTAARNTGTGGAVGTHQNPTIVSEMVVATAGGRKDVQLVFDANTYTTNGYNGVFKNTDKIIDTTKRKCTNINLSNVWDDTISGYGYTVRPTSTSVLYCIRCKK